MLRVSKLADYATAIMHFLATQPEQVFNAGQVAQHTGLAAPTVSKILKKLSEAKLVISIRGNNGGYKISRSPQMIPLLDVISAIEGHPALTECGSNHSVCTQDQICSVRHNWRVVNQMVLGILQKITLDDMNRPLSLHSLEKIVVSNHDQ